MRKLRQIALAAGVSLLAGLAVAGGCITKNVLQIDPQANLENKITKSDEKQARYLESLLDAPLDDFSELEILDNLVPSESMFLALAFYSYGLTNMALSDEIYREVAGRNIGRAIQKSFRPRIMDLFSGQFGNPLEGHLEDNVLYLGHLNLMMGAYALITGEDKYYSLQEQITDALSENFLLSPTAHLQTYTGDQWPADNVVALASLSLFDHLYDEDHSPAREAWKQWTKKHLDENSLMYSHIDNITLKPDEEPRGCAIAFSIPFINFFDPAFAQELYSNFRRTMFKNFLGISFARESLQDDYPSNVDSGPVIMDLGTVASAFAIGAAKISGDKETFTELSYAAEAATLPYEFSGRKGYLANVSLGESILLYGRTLRPWF